MNHELFWTIIAAYIAIKVIGAGAKLIAAIGIMTLKAWRWK